MWRRSCSLKKQKSINTIRFATYFVINTKSSKSFCWSLSITGNGIKVLGDSDVQRTNTQKDHQTLRNILSHSEKPGWCHFLFQYWIIYIRLMWIHHFSKNRHKLSVSHHLNLLSRAGCYASVAISAPVQHTNQDVLHLKQYLLFTWGRINLPLSICCTSLCVDISFAEQCCLWFWKLTEKKAGV